MTHDAQRLILMAAMAALAIFLGGCTPTQAPVNLAVEEKAILEADAAFMKAIAAKDLEQCMAEYADDAVVMDPGAPTVVGKAAILKGWKEFLANPEVTLTWTTAQLVVAKSGELAYQHGPYTSSLKDAKGKLVQDNGKYLNVWKKQAGGSWKIAAGMYNTDKAPPAAEKK